MTSGMIEASKSRLLAYIRHNRAFSHDYRDFEHHSIDSILDELHRRDPDGYLRCLDRLELHHRNEPVPA